MKLKAAFLTLSVAACISSTHADMFKPSPYCTKPSKPYQFTSEFQIQQYQRDVERYQRCLSDFVEEQSKAIQKHQQAANDAIDQWNRFVKYELK